MPLEFLWSSSTYIGRGTFLCREVGAPTSMFMIWQGIQTTRCGNPHITWWSHGIIHHARLDIRMSLHVNMHVRSDLYSKRAWNIYMYLCGFPQWTHTNHSHPKGEWHGNPYIQYDAHTNGQHRKYNTNAMVTEQSIYIEKWWCVTPRRSEIWEGLFHHHQGH